MQSANGTYSLKAQRIKYMASDFVMTSLAFGVFSIFRYRLILSSDLPVFFTESKAILEQIIVPFLLLGVYWISGYYNRPLVRSRLQELEITFYSSLFSAMAVYLLLYADVTWRSNAVTAYMIGLLTFLLMAFVYLGRIVITTFTIRHYRKIKTNSAVLIIGCSEKAIRVARQLSDSQTQFAFHIIGYIRIPGEKTAERLNATVYEEKDLDMICDEYGINQIIIAPEIRQDRLVMKYLGKAIQRDITVRIAPDTLSVITSGIKMNDILADPFIYLTSPRMSEFSKNIKLTSDIILSSLALVVLSPLMLLLALMVKSGSEGPAIYAQPRMGKGYKPFNIYKFRSMSLDAETNGPQLSCDNDPRITRIGRWMRKYRLDELPQLWNVIKGEMSIVGPRPEREFYIRQILERAPYYCLLSQVKPGITSWGLVKFGYASTIGEMVERARYDLIYLSNMSISIDIKIMIYTIRTILSGSGK